MKKLEYIDLFYNNQPEKEFVQELIHPVHASAPERWGGRKACSGEVGLEKGARLVRNFDDPGTLLDTAYEDFECFLKISGISGGEYPIRTVCAPTECFEAYRIEVTPWECDIIAADTEGIRRGLIFIEDEMQRRGGPFLPLKTIQRKPFIKSRITRCFFSPTNRPPQNGEELGDDADYYPDGYLNRLAHDGVNGVWIYTHFRDLLPSDIIPEYGGDSRRRLEKLNRTIEKCARYGIRVYILGVEPASSYRNPILAEKHKELLGHQWSVDGYTFCTGTEKGMAYAEESTKKLFTLSPGLAGLIVISVGESLSHCASDRMAVNCPNCKDKPPKEILAQTMAALERGMHAVKPEAELISWPYGQRDWGKEAVIEAAACVPEGTILMHNFEELGEPEQLGKKRLAVDYWLSYAGPSEMFERAAREAQRTGRQVFAKLQVCCSHEVASVPYVPVPGILYKKYKAMHEIGVAGAVQCWYFGNYPSVMGKAAGELSFEPFFRDESDFLHHLAGIYWGNDAPKAVAAWKYFEEGYQNFPVNLAFSWYGPMHDGPVWPLQLIPKNLPLAGTWRLDQAVGGDRIGECMCNGHNLEETVELCARMSDAWKKGIKILSGINIAENEGWKKEQVSVAKALDCQFESGYNILRFYRLREMLGLEKGEQRELLTAMENIVKREMDISRMLYGLSRRDKRLGYHSESEGYKYFPEKLEWRIKLLEELLKTEFVEVGRRIGQGLAPLEYYQGVGGGGRQYICKSPDIEEAVWENFMFEDGNTDENTRWRASFQKEYFQMHICCKQPQTDEQMEIWPEFRLMWPYPPLYIKPEGNFAFSEYVYCFSLYGDRLEKEKEKWKVTVIRDADEWKIEISVRRTEVGMKEQLRPFRLNLIRRNSRVSKWVFSEYYSARLIFGAQNHLEYGWVFPG